jgi:hypothetical protein
MIGNPSKKDYKGMVRNNLIAKCPITTSDVTYACNNFGPDLACVNEKSVRQTPAPVVADYFAVPRMLVESNAVVILAADVFFVDGTAYLLTVLQQIKFVIVEHLTARMATSLSKHLKRVLEMYGCAGFRVRTILMENLKRSRAMPTVEYNPTAAKEHVSEAKCTIQTLKKCM